MLVHILYVVSFMATIIYIHQKLKGSILNWAMGHGKVIDVKIAE